MQDLIIIVVVVVVIVVVVVLLNESPLHGQEAEDCQEEAEALDPVSMKLLLLLQQADIPQS